MEAKAAAEKKIADEAKATAASQAKAAAEKKAGEEKEAANKKAAVEAKAAAEAKVAAAAVPPPAVVPDPDKPLTLKERMALLNKGGGGGGGPSMIPMGGPRPDPRQRIIAFGAAAALVHPATGYQLCRMLAAAPHLSKALGASLRNSPDPDRAARAAYAAVWSREASLQREFALFGGEFLMTLDAEALRGWFDGFFKLDEAVWSGFLSGWRGLPGNVHHESRYARLLFGLSLLPKLPPPVTLKLASFILEYSLKHGTALMRSLTPFFGDGAYFAGDVGGDGPRPVGDAAVKAEIRARVGGHVGRGRG